METDELKDKEEIHTAKQINMSLPFTIVFFFSQILFLLLSSLKQLHIQQQTQIQHDPDIIQPEVLLFGYEQKRRPRIKDQNLEQEIARLGF